MSCKNPKDHKTIRIYSDKLKYDALCKTLKDPKINAERKMVEAYNFMVFTTTHHEIMTNILDEVKDRENIPKIIQEQNEK